MLWQGSSSLGMAFGGGLHRQPCSGSRCGAAPLWTASLGGFFAKSSSQSLVFAQHHPCNPGRSPQLTASLFVPRVMLQTPPAGTATSWDRFCWLQLCHLALGCKYPPFSGAVPGGSEFNPLLQKSQATSPPTCFIFHCAADPGAPNSFLPLNYFTRSIYLRAVCQRPFKL